MRSFECTQLQAAWASEPAGGLHVLPSLSEPCQMINVCCLVAASGLRLTTTRKKAPNGAASREIHRTHLLPTAPAPSQKQPRWQAPSCHQRQLEGIRRAAWHRSLPGCAGGPPPGCLLASLQPGLLPTHAGTLRGGGGLEVLKDRPRRLGSLRRERNQAEAALHINTSDLLVAQRG